MRYVQIEASTPDAARGANGGERRRRARRGYSLALLCLTAAVLPASPADAEGGSWQALADMPTPRRLLAAALHAGRVYTFGGCGSPCFDPTLHPSTFEETRVEVFDPAAGSWTARAPMPTVFFSGAAASLGGHIYLAGGSLTGNVLQRYHPASDSWALMAPMPTSRYGLALVASGGRLYAVGGSGPTGALEVYDPGSDSWSSRARMPSPRLFLAAAAVDGRLYAVGGSPDCCGDSQTGVLEIYDPSADSWSAGPPLPVAQQASAAAGLADRFYVFGGFIPGSGGRDEVFEYDPGLESWSSLARAPMPTGRDQAPAASDGRSAYVAGGSIDCHCQALDAFERFTAAGEEVPRTDLEITKSNGVSEVLGCVGTAVDYAITVTNLGPDPARGARVLDDFPAVLGLPTLDRSLDLDPGESITFEVGGTLAGDAEGVLCNTATVEVPAPMSDPDPSNNSATDCDPIVRIADLEIAKTNSVEEVFVCEPVGYTLVASNLGPCSVTGARVADVLPPELGVPPIDELVDLGAGESAVFSPSGFLDPEAGGILANSARIDPPIGVSDPAGDNNEDSDADPIRRRAGDPRMVKECVPAEAFAWSEVTCVVTLSNPGPDGVFGVAVTDDFPDSSLIDVTWTCAGSGGATCAASGIGDIEDLVDLPPGGAATYTATGTVEPWASHEICNTACLEPPAPECFDDADPANNCATACIDVLPDCNENRIDDAIDIANGTSADVNGDGIPDECQMGHADWTFTGSAEGGAVTVAVAGVPGLFEACTVVTPTVAGESPATVAAHNLADLDADPCLAPQDLTGTAMGAAVWLKGFLLSQRRVTIESADPGLGVYIPPIKIPTVSVWGLSLMALLLAAVGASRIARRRSRARAVHFGPEAIRPDRFKTTCAAGRGTLPESGAPRRCRGRRR